MSITRRGGGFLVRVTTEPGRGKLGGLYVEFTAADYASAASVARALAAELARTDEGLAALIRSAATISDPTLQNALDLVWGAPNGAAARRAWTERRWAAEVVQLLGPERTCTSIGEEDLRAVREGFKGLGRTACMGRVEAFGRMLKGAAKRDRPSELTASEREKLEARRDRILAALGERRVSSD